MRTPEKASDLGAFAFPRNSNRGGMNMEAPRPSILGGYRPGLRNVVGASATAYGYTLTVGPTSMLLTHGYGPPEPLEVLLFCGGAILAFALVGGPGLRGRVGALRRPSEKDPAVGKLPLPFGGVVCGRGLFGRSLRTERAGLAACSVRGDGHVPDGRGIRERCSRSGAKEELGFGSEA